LYFCTCRGAASLASLDARKPPDRTRINASNAAA
jgi:hypothetical protein